MQAVRVTDAKVLDAPMELVKGDVKAPSGVTGAGSVFAINHNADNALITLRYKLKDADIQMAEEPFEAAGTKFNRGLVHHQRRRAGRSRQGDDELGLKAVALAAAPSVKTHPVRAPRVALLHTWLSTQTEGWWRQAFDANKVPYDYISTQDVAKDANLSAKYDVIIFGPGGGQAGHHRGHADVAQRDAVEELAGDAEHRHVGADRRHPLRPGAGRGSMHIRDFVKKGGVFIGATTTARIRSRWAW